GHQSLLDAPLQLDQAASIQRRVTTCGGRRKTQPTVRDGLTTTGSDEIGQHCFEREQKLSGVNDNEEGSVRLNLLNCDPIEGRVLESEKLIRKPPNELGIH
ncbi:hypothetical protein, partial [Pseudomonas aeruginosa]|uniref:hypothetical protein n=1 Tax=Pseudomonas aeruginosa TaxID=287 RepID=UPI0021E7AD1F